ncbi:MAG: 4-oxalocrotonate decarboxylase [Thermorudis peleae]|nr:4-oxalocrotonate decarboxylase [Thermorudis peleae]
MTLSTHEQHWLEAIQRARAERRTLPSGSLTPPLDLTSAYRVQAALRGDRQLIGYKLGLVSPSKQAQMGLTAPITGWLSADMLHQSPVVLSYFLQPRIEPEVAAVLQADIPPDATPGRALLAVGAWLLAVEILDSIWEGYRFTAPEVVADNASGGAILLGERALDWPFDGELRLTINGQDVATGPIAALGDLPAQLCWLAQQVGGLHAGQVIMFGSPAPAVPLHPGTVALLGPTNATLVFAVTQHEETING